MAQEILEGAALETRRGFLDRMPAQHAIAFRLRFGVPLIRLDAYRSSVTKIIVFDRH